MLKNIITGLAVVTCVVLALAISGCICCNFGAPEEVTPMPELEPTEVPTQAPTETPVEPTEEPGTPGPTPEPTDATPTPAATPATTPVSGIMDAEMVGYGTDKDTYSRGDTATCYVDIKNTGEVPIDKVEFVVNVYTTRPIIGTFHAIKDQVYTVDQQNIQPGTTQRVEISVIIPETYQGISTAGDYEFNIVVRVGDKDIGSFSKDIKVV